MRACQASPVQDAEDQDRHLAECSGGGLQVVHGHPVAGVRENDLDHIIVGISIAPGAVQLHPHVGSAANDIGEGDDRPIRWIDRNEVARRSGVICGKIDSRRLVRKQSMVGIGLSISITITRVTARSEVRLIGSGVRSVIAAKRQSKIDIRRLVRKQSVVISITSTRVTARSTARLIGSGVRSVIAAKR